MFGRVFGFLSCSKSLATVLAVANSNQMLNELTSAMVTTATLIDPTRARKPEMTKGASNSQIILIPAMVESTLTRGNLFGIGFSILGGARTGTQSLEMLMTFNLRDRTSTTPSIRAPVK